MLLQLYCVIVTFVKGSSLLNFLSDNVRQYGDFSPDIVLKSETFIRCYYMSDKSLFLLLSKTKGEVC